MPLTEKCEGTLLKKCKLLFRRAVIQKIIGQQSNMSNTRCALCFNKAFGCLSLLEVFWFLQAINISFLATINCLESQASGKQPRWNVSFLRFDKWWHILGYLLFRFPLVQKLSLTAWKTFGGGIQWVLFGNNCRKVRMSDVFVNI